jgi:tryptophanyl-tRNA synthetase
MKPVRVLTGIKPSGVPHLGNYVGAIRPTVRASRQPQVDSFLFLADYHAMVSTQDPARLHRSTLDIAATWIACGLDPQRVTFYRQSDIPEIPELTWFLACVCGKGQLNRAHAYKAMLDKNAAAGSEPDDGVSTGLFIYPVLMAADIILFNAHQVPVGRDQVQHIEMARDMASSFNHWYGAHFTLPEAVIEDSVATLPGLDGRKMSKSYDNVIPLFAPPAQLRKLIMGIVTDSKAAGEPKQTEGSALFQIYQAFATPDETAALAQAYAEGIGWGEVKQRLFERIDCEMAPMRATYDALMADPARVQAILQAGAAKARTSAVPFMARLRHAVGLRPLQATATDASSVDAPSAKADKADKAPLPTFKQYREQDGLFYFKLTDAKGRVLLQSAGLASPKDAGASIARLKAQGYLACTDLHDWADAAAGVTPNDIELALQALRAAE